MYTAHDHNKEGRRSRSKSRDRTANKTTSYQSYVCVGPQLKAASEQWPALEGARGAEGELPQTHTALESTSHEARG